MLLEHNFKKLIRYNVKMDFNMNAVNILGKLRQVIQH